MRPAPLRPCDNPFRVQRLRELRYRVAGGSLEGLLDRLAELGQRAALVGPEGSGKTTLLGQLQPLLEARGFEVRRARVYNEPPFWSRAEARALVAGVGAGHFLLVDGADALPSWRLARLRWNTRRAGGLLITSHQAGPLPTLLECRTSEELLRELATELLGAAPVSGLPPLDEVYRRHGGNLREALRELYDVCAGLGPGC